MNPTDLKHGHPINLGVLGVGNVVGEPISVYPFTKVGLWVEVDGKNIHLELPSDLDVGTTIGEFKP